MSKFTQLLRGLLISLPILVISGVAIFGVSAQIATAVPTGKISTQDMTDFESYPSGVNELSATNVPPLIMLVMSRDEQLFNKAYPDYTDLNNDGVVDTTYQNAFDYKGYFDPTLCYTYGSGVFSAIETATNHQCTTGNWSGNFLNWVSMSRIDIIRWVLYGGTRSIDKPAVTVLERAEIPDDLHAWSKVYSGADINKYAPYKGTHSFCNVSDGVTGKWLGSSDSASGISTTPQIRVASGDWSDWATTAKLQCQWSGSGEGDSNRPSASGNDSYTARIKVCQNASPLPNESYCVATGTSLKPEGLLQKYSAEDPLNQKRFGLVTGSWTTPRKGGQLRRNIGKLDFNVPGTPCATGDEFNSSNGTFCYKQAGGSTSEGIVMTLDRLQIIGWNGHDYGTSGTTKCAAPGGTAWGARGYDIQDHPSTCPDFGNPLAGMYAEALRYIQGEKAPINSDTGSALPTPLWVDPYGDEGDGKQRNPPCATCSIVVISSGLNSFDDANVPTVAGDPAATMTNALQTQEGISGQYLLSTYFNNTSLTGAPANGSLTAPDTIYSDMAICSPAVIGNLSAVTGVCLGTPGQEGSYAIAGLSYGAWTTPIRLTNVSSNFKVKTYGISLSDNLPSFSIPVGDNSISLSPTCRADPATKGTLASCYIGSVALGARMNQKENTTYGLTPTAAFPHIGSYYLVWEDSQYGSDHDQDATNVITWCVGKSCNMPSTVVKKSGAVAICDPLVVGGVTSGSTQGGACNSDGTLVSAMGDKDIIVRNQWLGFSSVTMYIGFQLSGTTADTVTEVSNSGVSSGCNMLADIKCNSKPQVVRFTLGSGAAVSALKSPLWYAAKYSAYTGSSPFLPPGQDPPNYFFARNAGALKDQLDAVFQEITSAAANNFGNATTPSSSNDVKGNGLAYQVQYFQARLGVKWSGSLQAFWSDDNGYRREGTVDKNGNQVLDDSAEYIVSGKDTTAGALAGATATYRCTIAPIPTGGATSFEPSTNSACVIESAGNPLIPAWDAGTLLNAYYDPTTTAGAAAIANMATQRSYGADAGATANAGERYIFTYLTSTPDTSTGSGTVANGTQTDFVWKDASCDATSGAYALSATSGFCGAYDDTKKVRTGNYGLLNEKDPALAKELVNWVRGAEYPADYRSRTNNLTTGKKNTYRLGDIVDSSPMIVGKPSESYDLLYSDHSYSSFLSNYRNRRQMVYVGANDGMLHAFNGGFYVTGQGASGTTAATNPTAYRTLPTGLVSGNTTVPSGNDWTLGQEVWAFVPGNLLPHLRWLAQKDYTHVFYVDGSPVVTDAKIFTSATITGSSDTCKSGKPATADIDAKGHVCGWGTVMAVPFRLGGGPISVDTVGSGTAADFQTSNSAYVLLDVTDPEQPPTVLGEITTGSFTTSSPAFSVHKESDGKLHYLLTIGSGPADNGGPAGTKIVAAADGSKLGVWVYDLQTIYNDKSSTPAVSLTTTGPDNSFAGDMISSDFDLDNSAEGVYFGVVTNPVKTVPTDPQLFLGGLWKLNMNTGTTDLDTSNPSTFTLKQVINTGQPVTARPTLALDTAGRPMVYFGSGRSFTADDDSGKSAQGTQQQYIYGVSDNSLLTGMDSTCQVMPTVSKLFNATAVAVGTDGAVSGLPTTGFDDVATLANLQGMLTATADTTPNCFVYSGWKMALEAGSIAGDSDAGIAAQTPSERVVSSQTLLSGVLLTPTYLPPSKATIDASGTSDCNPVPVPGSSNLYGMNYLTGTADPVLFGSFGGSSTSVNKKVSLGSGKASAPVLHSSNGKVMAAFGLSGGTKLQDIGELGAAKNGEISWREPLENQ